jgi:hypothetical protein
MTVLGIDRVGPQSGRSLRGVGEDVEVDCFSLGRGVVRSKGAQASWLV